MADPVVEVDTGRLVGRRLHPSGLLFAAVPYAAAPVGPLRFRPPAPPTAWAGVRDARDFPPAPEQSTSFLPGLGATSEDCLHLNVWTPDTGGRKPVVVWLFPGGFEYGSASPPQTDGAALMRLGDVVAISVDHRLGALGFLHLAGLDPDRWGGASNLGHLDQVAALRWVRSNAASFGGDPADVTVAGESAGGFSIGAMAAMPAAAGLFDKALLVSGQTSRLQSAETATEQAHRVLSLLGITRPDDVHRVPARALVEAQQAVVDTDFGVRNRPGGRIWGGVVDGRTVLRHPADSVRDGAWRDVPVVVCSATEEAGLFDVTGGPGYAPVDAAALVAEVEAGVGATAATLLEHYRARHPGAGLRELRTRYLTDYIYRARAARLAADQARAGGRAWNLLLDRPSPTTDRRRGAHHGAFGAHLVGAAGDTREGAAIRSRLVEVVASTAWQGDPGWAPVDAAAPAALVLAEQERIAPEPSADVLELWSQVEFP